MGKKSRMKRERRGQGGVSRVSRAGGCQVIVSDEGGCPLDFLRGMYRADFAEAARKPFMAEDIEALRAIDASMRELGSTILRELVSLIDFRTGEEAPHSYPVAAFLLSKWRVASWMIDLAARSQSTDVDEMLACALDNLDELDTWEQHAPPIEALLREAFERFDGEGLLAELSERLGRGRARSSPAMRFVALITGEIEARAQRAELEAVAQATAMRRESSAPSRTSALRL